MGADLSKPEFQRFTPLSLNEAFSDDEFRILIAPVIQTLSPEAKQALGTFILDDRSTSSALQSESPITKPNPLGSSSASSSTSSSTSGTLQSEPPIIEPSSNPLGSSSISSPTSNTLQSEPPVIKPSSNPLGSLAGNLSKEKVLQLDPNLRFWLSIKEEQLCIYEDITEEYLQWTKNWHLLFAVSKDEFQTDGNINSLLGARYEATVRVEKDAQVGNICSRFLMLFYDGLYRLMPNYKYLATVISIATRADVATIDNRIRKWVEHGGKFHALGESLGSCGYLFLLPASISNDMLVRLPFKGPKHEAAVSFLEKLKIKEKMKSAGADKLSENICNGLLRPFQIAAENYNKTMRASKIKRPHSRGARLKPSKKVRPNASMARVATQDTTSRVGGLSSDSQHLENRDPVPQPRLIQGGEDSMGGQLVQYIDRADNFPLQENSLAIQRVSMNQISPRISNLRTIPSEPNVDARIAVTSQSPDRTQEIFPILSREGNDARPGLIIDSVSHHYNSYARPPMRSSDYPQGGPYDHLNPPSALDLSILDGYPQGGPYDHLNPPPALDLSIFDDYPQGGPYDHLNPPPALDLSILDDYPQGGPYDHLNPPSAIDPSIFHEYPQGGPYDHLNPPPAPDPSALVDQGQHADAPDIGLINGALPISYKQNGPQ